jgi:hypothetical protein
MLEHEIIKLININNHYINKGWVYFQLPDNVELLYKCDKDLNLKVTSRFITLARHDIPWMTMDEKTSEYQKCINKAKIYMKYLT